ncbi:MAG: universal stress protein, partial [Ginsengibacter sp.]
MKQRFIILIDFSENSGNLLKYAYNWSLQKNAELLLVNQSIVVIPAFAESQTKKSATWQTNKEASRKLEELANSVLPSLDSVSYSVSENQLQFTLPEHLEESFEHLIFVGLKRDRTTQKILFGSVAI